MSDDCLALRGQEQSLLQGSPKARNAVVSVRDQIYHAYKQAWIQTHKKIQNYAAEMTAWRDHRMFTIGGGSLVRALVDPMRVHPSGANPHIQPAFLEPPPDLIRADGKKIHREELRFIMVGYGLSNIGLSIPEAFTPNEVPPMPEPSALASKETTSMRNEPIPCSQTSAKAFVGSGPHIISKQRFDLTDKSATRARRQPFVTLGGRKPQRILSTRRLIAQRPPLLCLRGFGDACLPY